MKTQSMYDQCNKPFRYRPSPNGEQVPTSLLLREDSVTSFTSSSSQVSFENDDGDDIETMPLPPTRGNYYCSARDLAASYQAMTNPSMNESLYSLNSLGDSSTTTTTSSSGITFYQSSCRFHYMERTPEDASTAGHGSTKNPNPLYVSQHRGIDRNISLPRERHMASDLSLSSLLRDSGKDPRIRLDQTVSGNSTAPRPLTTEAPSIVSPEVTRPSTQRIPSTSSHASWSRNLSSSRSALSLRPPSLRRNISTQTNSPNSTISGNTNHSQIHKVTAPSSPTESESSSSPTSSDSRDKVYLEIAPGVQVHLRGAEETQTAIANGFFVHCECFVCDNGESNDAIYCILDCDYFLCPDCRSVFPNPIHATGGSPSSEMTGGLGLGFRISQ